jgi:hypothetical protein
MGSSEAIYGTGRGSVEVVVVPRDLMREARRRGFRPYGFLDSSLLPFVDPSVVNRLADVEARKAAAERPAESKPVAKVSLQKKGRR